MSHTTFKNFFCHFSFQYKQPFYGLFQPAAKVTQYNGNILKQKQYPTYSTKEMSYLTVVLLHNDGFIKMPFKVKNLLRRMRFIPYWPKLLLLLLRYVWYLLRQVLLWTIKDFYVETSYLHKYQVYVISNSANIAFADIFCLND